MEYNVTITEAGMVVFDLIRDLGRPTTASSPEKAIANAKAHFANKMGYGSRVGLFWHQNSGKYNFNATPYLPSPKPEPKPVSVPKQLKLFKWIRDNCRFS